MHGNTRGVRFLLFEKQPSKTNIMAVEGKF